MYELVKQIRPVSPEIRPKDDKVANRVARRNHEIYDGKYYLVELEEKIRVMK